MMFKSLQTKITASLLALSMLGIAPPLCHASILNAVQLGTVLTGGTTRIDDTVIPSGTTLFTGDRIVSELPALIHLDTGGRIEIVRAAARFSRHEEQLVVHVEEGQLSFVINEGEAVQIVAGEYRLTADRGFRNSGRLSVDSTGRMTMNVIEGVFTATDQVTETQTELKKGDALATETHRGTGSLSLNGTTITDNALSVPAGKFRGMCVVVGREAYAVSGNTGNVISIQGTWKQLTGEYQYQILECEAKMLIQAGATPESARNAVSVAVFGAPQVTGSNTRRNTAIILGIGAGVGIPLVIKAAKSDDKSPSSR
jgi:hypothetical protein